MSETPFDKLTLRISHYFKEHNLAPLSLGAERHGSWEWTGFRILVITRYVSVYLTEELEALGDDPHFILEVWAGADNDQRFSRQRTALLRIGTRDLTREGFFERLEVYLDIAWTRAEGITIADLSEAYFVPRPV